MHRRLDKRDRLRLDELRLDAPAAVEVGRPVVDDAAAAGPTAAAPATEEEPTTPATGVGGRCERTQGGQGDQNSESLHDVLQNIVGVRESFPEAGGNVTQLPPDCQG